jgi:hypothetical protein
MKYGFGLMDQQKLYQTIYKHHEQYFSKKDSHLNISCNCNDYHNSIEAECEAIEYALSNVPINQKVRVFSDCLSAIRMIMNPPSSWDSGKILRNPCRYVLRRINCLLNHRSAQTFFQYIPSHIEQKLQNYTKFDPKKREKLNDFIKLLKESYGEYYDQIIQGNIESDDMAKRAINENKEYKIPYG